MHKLLTVEGEEILIDEAELLVMGYRRVTPNRIVWGEPTPAEPRHVATVEDKPSHRRSPLDRAAQSREAKRAILERIGRG